METRDGYPDQVYAALRPSRPTLKLVKLGCPGETTSTMINGGICHYQGGSQLNAAVAFLRAHHGRVLLVTIDIGANDPEHCAGQPSLTQLASCGVTGIPAAVTHLTTIMARLKAAAGPGVRIVGMNYYLPALAEWRDGLPGHLVAWAAERLAATYNDMLDRVYTKSGARVADVFGAFDTADFADRGSGAAGGPPAQCRPAVPVDLGVRCSAPRAQPARQPGRLSGHRPRVPASLRTALSSRGRNARLDTATPATEAGNCDLRPYVYLRRSCMGAGTTVSILPCGAMTADLTWLLLAPGRAIRNRQNKHLPAE